MKIVSLLPSATEILYALGLEDQLAGVSSDCDFPPQARAKPAVSSTALSRDDASSPASIDQAVRDKMAVAEPLYRLDRELIQTLRPDLIVAQDLCRVCAVPSGHVEDALEVIGCNAEVLSLDPGGLGDVLSGIEDVGDVTGRGEEARRMVQRLRDRIDAVREAVDGVVSVLAVALEWSDPPFIGGHWIPEMLAIAGATDALGIPKTPSRRVEWAEIRAASPDVIVHMPCGYGLDDAVAQARGLYRLGSVRATPAGELKRVYGVDGSSYFSRPGPRLVDGIEILAWVFHPERVAAPPPGRAARVTG